MCWAKEKRLMLEGISIIEIEPTIWKSLTLNEKTAIMFNF